MDKPEIVSGQTWHSLWEKKADLAKEIDYHFLTRQPLYALLERSIAVLGRSEALRALEIGCGTAIDSCILAKNKKIRLFCFDFSFSAIKLAEKTAQEFGSRLGFVNCDANRTCFKDKSFDLIFSQGVLEHFRDISWPVEEQVRLLKDDGILVIDVPQTYTLCTLFKHHRIKKGTWPYGWETQFSYRDLIDLGNRYGLEAIDVCGHEYDSYVRFFNLALFRNIIKRFQSKNPMRNGTFFTKVESCYDKFWNILEKKWGHYFLVNIAVAFRKKKDDPA